MKKVSNEANFQKQSLSSLRECYTTKKIYTKGKDIGLRMFQMMMPSKEKYVVSDEGALVLILNKADYDKLLFQVNQTIKFKLKEIWKMFSFFHYWEVRNIFEDLLSLMLPLSIDEGQNLFTKG